MSERLVSWPAGASPLLPPLPQSRHPARLVARRSGRRRHESAMRSRGRPWQSTPSRRRRGPAHGRSRGRAATGGARSREGVRGRRARAPLHGRGCAVQVCAGMPCWRRPVHGDPCDQRGLPACATNETCSARACAVVGHVLQAHSAEQRLRAALLAPELCNTWWCASHARGAVGLKVVASGYRVACYRITRLNTNSH